MNIDPLMTCHPVTGAVRPVTSGLLREVYLAQRECEPDLTELLVDRPGPWSTSHVVAPEASEHAIAVGWRDLAQATPGLDPAAIDTGAMQNGRAKIHLEALRDLWLDAGAGLPEDLAVARHVLRSGAGDALEQLVVLDPVPCRFATPLQQALQATLVAHHGQAQPEVLRQWQAHRPSVSAPGTGALGNVQANLSSAASPVPLDGSLAVWGLRDPAEEAAFAAGLVRRMLDDGKAGMPSEIGVLIPDDPLGRDLLIDAFDFAGIPLSGAPGGPARRDCAGEFVTLLIAVLESSAAPMTMAGLYVSPLMPWPHSTGAAMAREVMDHGYSKLACNLEGQDAALHNQLSPVHGKKQLLARLDAIADLLAPQTDLATDVAEVRAQIGVLRRALGEATIDWSLARSIAAPKLAVQEDLERYVEGVSLFGATTLPWRTCRHLIVTGVAGHVWPRPIPASPIFLDRELIEIRAKTGLVMPTRGEVLTRNLELFRRQICAASESLTLTVPAMDAAGKRQAMSGALALIARSSGADKPEDLIRDLRAEPAEDWPVPSRSVAPVPLGGRPDLPTDGQLRLGGDLTLLRRDEDTGQAKPQSPSRLETLVISPLAWVLKELDLQDVPWLPQTLNVLKRGSILHKVLEIVFPKNSPIPDAATVSLRIDDALDAGIALNASFLGDEGWAAERASLRREAEKVCQIWRHHLEKLGAQIIGIEEPLSGDGFGLRLFGIADCILRLPDGRILIVDHKRSGSKGRERRMELGWDLQVALYRMILERAERTEATEGLIGRKIGVAYHLMLDGRVLSQGLPGVGDIDDKGGDISGNVLALLRERIAALGAGLLPLNREGDAARFHKDCGITAYALEGDPFLAAFQIDEEEEEPENV